MTIYSIHPPADTMQRFGTALHRAPPHLTFNAPPFISNHQSSGSPFDIYGMSLEQDGKTAGADSFTMHLLRKSKGPLFSIAGMSTKVNMGRFSIHSLL